jgi:hypothetical protein
MIYLSKHYKKEINKIKKKDDVNKIFIMVETNINDSDIFSLDQFFHLLKMNYVMTSEIKKNKSKSEFITQ